MQAAGSLFDYRYALLRNNLLTLTPCLVSLLLQLIDRISHIFHLHFKALQGICQALIVLISPHFLREKIYQKFRVEAA